MTRTFKIMTLLIAWLFTVPLSIAIPLRVSVTIAPQKYFLKKIGGDLIKVNLLVRPGADPHTYEPSPKQMVIMSQSQLYFSIGIEFEEIWLPRFKSANPKLKFIAQDQGIPKLKMEGLADHNRTVEDDNHNSMDPHIWLSPPLVKPQMLNILSALIAEDPKNSAVYRKNYDTFLEEIDQLYLELKQQLSGQLVSFAVFHPSWGYFAQAFGLRQIAIEVEGKSPKPRQLQRIIQNLRDLKIKSIFVQPQFSQRSANIVARAIKGRVLILDPMAENWEQNLRQVTNLLLQ